MKLSTKEKIRAQALIDYGSRVEQLEGRIMLHGFDSLTDAEEVEFHLYYYKPKKGMDVQALAQRMVEKYGDLSRLALLGVRELMQVEGMYRGLAQRFTNYGKLLRKYVRYERIYQRDYIRNITELCRYVLPLYRKSPLPGTWQLCLNETYEVIYGCEIAPSLAWGEYMDEALTDAQYSSCKYVIIVLMCGRQFADPKPYDKKNAKLFAQRLEEIGCWLLDVVLVDEGKLTSMHEEGMLTKTARKRSDRQVYTAEAELKVIK